MEAVAGPSSPTIRKKLSAIPEEPFPLPPTLRRSKRRPPPPASAAEPDAETPTSQSSPDPNLSEDQLVLYAEAKALYTSGVDTLKEGKKGVAQALPFFQQAYTLFMVELHRPDKAEKALSQAAWCMATLALRALREKEFDQAIKGFEESRTIYRAIAEASSSAKATEAKAKEAMALFQLGIALGQVKDITGATETIKEASQIFASIRREPEEAMCLCELADLLTRRDPAAALFFLKQSLLLYCKLEDSYKEARTLFAIGSLASKGTDYASAFAYFVQARVIFRRRGDSMDDANCSYQLGKLATKGHQYPAAVTYFEEASNLYHAQKQPLDEAWCYYRLALVLLKLKYADSSELTAVELPIDYLTEARNLFREAGEREAEGSCLMRLGEILKAVDPDTAKSCLKEALDYIDPERNVKGRRTTIVLQQLEAAEERRLPTAPVKAWWAT